ncbi:hypothetical protein VNO78_22702 [Psophocarpus tetragonolobus]|uniref:Uncharacterized protein n=1 Tax=Psophocarpus tetragonolobus TaxID=3891 RepID=A0AAN9S221_PSOTE
MFGSTVISLLSPVSLFDQSKCNEASPLVAFMHEHMEEILGRKSLKTCRLDVSNEYKNDGANKCEDDKLDHTTNFAEIGNDENSNNGREDDIHLSTDFEFYFHRKNIISNELLLVTLLPRKPPEVVVSWSENMLKRNLLDQKTCGIVVDSSRCPKDHLRNDGGHLGDMNGVLVGGHDAITGGANAEGLRMDATEHAEHDTRHLAEAVVWRTQDHRQIYRLDLAWLLELHLSLKTFL